MTCLVYISLNLSSLEFDELLEFLSLSFTEFEKFSAIHFFKDFIYSFLERGEGREEEKERDTSMCERNIDLLPLAHAYTTYWAQAFTLTWNQTGNLLLCGTMPNQLNLYQPGLSYYFFK